MYIFFVLVEPDKPQSSFAPLCIHPIFIIIMIIIIRDPSFQRGEKRLRLSFCHGEHDEKSFL